MLQERDGVTLHGLGSRPDLNGRTGTLVQWHDERQRLAVELDESGESIWVKPENVSRQEPEAALEAALTPELYAGARAWLSQPVEVVTKAREPSVLHVLLTLSLSLSLALSLSLSLALQPSPHVVLGQRGKVLDQVDLVRLHQLLGSARPRVGAQVRARARARVRVRVRISAPACPCAATAPTKG